MPFASGSFDIVVCFSVLHHIPNVSTVVNEMFRVLQPGGRLVIYTPSASHYVERMKAANFILKQLPGHIAVRRGEVYASALAAQPWANVALEYLPSSYPLFGFLDRLLAPWPLVGPCFRFRILVLAVKA